MKKIIFLSILLLILFSSIQVYSDDTTYIDKKYGFSITYPSNYYVLKNYKELLLLIYFPRMSFFGISYVSIVAKRAGAAAGSAEKVIDIYFKYSKSVSEKKYVTINDTNFLSVIMAQKKFFFNIKQHHLITTKGNYIYIITYTALLDTFDRHLDRAKEIMHSFRFLGEGD